MIDVYIHILELSAKNDYGNYFCGSYFYTTPRQMKIKNGLLFYVVFKTILLADIEAIVSEMVNETAELLFKS